MEWVYPHIRRVRSLLRGRGWSSHKTDDLVQDLYVQVLSHHRTGESIRDPEAFLARIALNLSTNAYRREHRELYVGRPVEELGLAANREFAPEECVAAAQIAERLVKALENLEPRTRDAYLLHRHHGLTYAQIGEQLDMTVRTVENRIVKAMTVLATAVQG